MTHFGLARVNVQFIEPWHQMRFVCQIPYSNLWANQHKPCVPNAMSLNFTSSGSVRGFTLVLAVLTTVLLHETQTNPPLLT
jgi:hypothetical protein